MGKIRTVGLGAVLGGAGAYAVKRFSDRSEQAGRAVGAPVYGSGGWGSRGGRDDDTTLTHKVESELFRDAHEAKGHVSVNTANGVVQLRGEVERRELIDELVERARSIEGVRNVENLLHLPGEEAPMHQ